MKAVLMVEQMVENLAVWKVARMAHLRVEKMVEQKAGC
jgi:hypothetical protein